MDDILQGAATTLIWSLFRFGLPVGLTLLVCWLFRKLDARWQAEAAEYQKQVGAKKALFPALRCWLKNECPPEQRERCLAYQNQDIPCWQHFRASDGQLKEDCIGCDVFRGAPAPVIGD
ncbi:MAG: hypothetical protein PVG32_05465 [Anaerolineales bacterium]|jgi:hypothetical protein